MPSGDSVNGDAKSPFHVDNDALLRLERMRVQEALVARDVAVSRLADACASVKEKSQALSSLEAENTELRNQLKTSTLTGVKGGEDKENVSSDPTDCLDVAIQTVEEKLAELRVSEEDGLLDIENRPRTASRKVESAVTRIAKLLNDNAPVLGALRDVTNANTPTTLLSPLVTTFELPDSPWTPLDCDRPTVLPTINTAEKIDARYAILASLPLPSGVPEDSLTPILIPPPYALHDFIGTTSGHLRSQLGNYRVFQQSTTTWCPDREEHGYYLTPVFKCSTNPRVNTAHRWSVVDFAPKLDKPTECFFNKDGKWYYAGIYKSFRLDDLCTQEWECLSTETSQALIKETLANRKNTSPQNVYETGQLYSAGALRVACIGLQCIGFNNALYRGLLEHAALCTQAGKWRATSGGFAGGLGLGSGGGVVWNSPTMGTPVPLSGPASPMATNIGSVIGSGRPGTCPGPIQPPQTPTLRIHTDVAQDSPTFLSTRLSTTT